MRHIWFVLLLAQVIVGISNVSWAEISCSQQAAGVSGVISDRKDMIASVNCLGQQLAALRSAIFATDQVEAAKIETLAREITALSAAVGSVSQRVDTLERNYANIQRPLAERPW